MFSEMGSPPFFFFGSKLGSLSSDELVPTRSPPFLLPLRGDPVLFRAFIYFPFCLTVVDGGRSSREEPTAAPAEAEERGYRCQLSGTGTRSRTGCRTTP